MKRISALLDPYRGLPKEIYVIFVSRIINAMGCFVMPLLTLILTEKIGLSKEISGAYISVSGLLFMPAAIIGGKLTDIIGRKKVIIIFDFLSAMLYIVCGFMNPSINMIYVLMIASMSMAIAGPAHDALIADLTTPKNRDGAYALSYMGWNIGFAIGPIIGGLLYENYLPLIFIGDAVTALISLSLIFIFIKETIHLTKQEVTGEGRHLETREEGTIISVLLKRPILIYFAICTLGYNFVYSQWSFMMPIHSAQNFLSLGAKYYGLMAGFNGLIVMFFTPLITKMSENTKHIRKMIYGGLLYAFGFGMLGILNTLPFFFVSVFIFTLGEIILSISIAPFIANHTPMSHRGRMNAVLPIIFGMGYTLGPITMGKALGYISIESAWLILGMIAFISSIFMCMLEKYDEKEKKKKRDIFTIVG
ncbi:MFS transporter [Clostridium estertheticum]|uniref:MFS transporter n=1 Tax=Clostridium estertheticum TaxID=238834 RepID=UPI0013E98C86|nr:MFS transporter [Clostridium estertheticum]MBZ9688419.1 MFS transporter [Clostridium estertheticum]